ncbi:MULTISPECIES: TetR/AcrR family transcriptional regulator C-terminal domain-containing protein [Streptacidiphilus]|uniref:TetR/AcrR family transcriptional regulator C-terminal domain-containing protein n=1 Tax=Streptacidiphilus cavernicola TaxID=3342716 RepID=A0ABV6UW33_9ACTN|nr:TetR/AcrR family transcriptional regulator C-terminal domain-containing protein [Streptacidiphilus jeojiense]
MTDTSSPYLRIAAELRERIVSGELTAGERLPSTRQIVREHGVAMATASKVLAVLCQEGSARAVPGVGTVVEGPVPPDPRPGRTAAGPQRLSVAAIVRTATALADADGLTALSLRRTAADLGVTTMALYRHVPGKAQLLLMMADAAFAEFPLPEPPPHGWRARLDAAARMQWAMFRRHPWLAQATSFTRPLLSPRALAHGEWVLRALDGLGLDPVTMIHVHAVLAAHVRGLAANLETEAEAVQDTGIDDTEWMDRHGTPALTSPRLAAALPLLASVPEHSLDLDTLFEFGLARLLDGIAVLIGDAADAER